MRQIPIYYINLKSRPDRRAFMEEQFERLGLSAIRIEAVETSDLTEEQRHAYCNPTKRWSMIDAQYCCNLSHAKAWRAAFDAGHSQSLILEDDAILSASLPRFLRAIAATETPLASIIRVEAWPPAAKRYLRDGDIQIDGDLRLRKCVDRDAGAAGYILDREMVPVLLSERRFHTALVDGFLFNPMSALGRRTNVLYADPGLCVQLGVIESPRSEAKSSIGGAWTTSYAATRRRHPFKNLAKQVEIWVTYDLPRARAALRRLLRNDVMSEHVQFRAD